MLQNNSSEMATVVETYLQEETVELLYDNEQLDQWNRQVAELGLVGQTKIAKPEKSPVPFLHIKPNMKNVLECLCPSKVNVKEFSITPIPVEILDLIALSVREGYFDKIEVWYDGANPDPAAIGMKYTSWYSHKDDGGLDKSFPTAEEAMADMKAKGYSKTKPYGTSEQYYLIGKWGDIKQSFEELKDRAFKRFLEEKGVLARTKIRDLQRTLDDLETTAYEMFSAGTKTHFRLP